MKFVLLNNSKGHALYKDDALVATWDKHETAETLAAAVFMWTGPDEVATDLNVRDNAGFADKLPADLKKKLAGPAETPNE